MLDPKRKGEERIGIYLVSIHSIVCGVASFCSPFRQVCLAKIKSRWIPPSRSASSPPESTESSDSDEEPPYKMNWTLGRLSEMSESEIRELYDDIEEPFYYHHNQFKFRNKAQLRLDEEIEKAMAEYRERSKNLTAFDAIAPPRIAGICGSVVPLTITDDIRPILIGLCKLALEDYNTKNQGENFVFDDLVKSTNRGISCGRMYYITFQAKAGGTTETFHFQAASDQVVFLEACPT